MSACIGPRATVSISATVRGSARVYDSATVCGSARVSGSACVSGSARVSGSACVYDSAYVSGSARVSGSTFLDGHARVNGNDILHGVDGGYPWTAFFEAPDGTTDESEWVLILRFGCERHNIDAWTPAFQRRKCEKHDRDAAPHLARVVRTVKAYFADMVEVRS